MWNPHPTLHLLCNLSVQPTFSIQNSLGSDDSRISFHLAQIFHHFALPYLHHSLVAGSTVTILSAGSFEFNWLQRLTVIVVVTSMSQSFCLPFSQGQ